jgi:hypothetical protein
MNFLKEGTTGTAKLLMFNPGWKLSVFITKSIAGS